MQFLGMICIASKEKREIIAAFGKVLSGQMGMAPAPFLDTIDATARVADMLMKAQAGDEMLKREAQRLYEYNAVEMPVALGDRSGFVIIGSIGGHSSDIAVDSVGAAYIWRLSDCALDQQRSEKGVPRGES